MVKFGQLDYLKQSNLWQKNNIYVFFCKKILSNCILKKKTIVAFLNNIEFSISQVILWIFVVLTSIQVILRYIFNNPLDWPEELNQILLVWMTFIGGIGLSRKNLHLRVDIVDDFLPKKILIFLRSFFNISTIIFMAIIIIGGIELFNEMIYERTPAMRLKLSYVYLIVPISSFFIIIIYFFQLYKDYKSFFKE